MEILDLYDNNFNKLNETVNRGDIIPKNKNILLSIIFIYDNNNNYLIQKTSKEKGNLYSSTGGHVIHNENGLNTIIRELKEELGININKDKIEFVDRFKYPNKACLFELYKLKINKINLKKLKLQKEEVEDVLLLNKNEIINLIENNLFLESHGYIFKKYIIHK